MSFLIRSARAEDLDSLYELARQFTLLNLPADKKVLGELIHSSEQSFLGKVPLESSVYLFVGEDVENQVIVASSLIHGRCGTEASPNYSYQILKRDLFSQDLGIGFIHQVLRLKSDSDGPSEIGGLLVDKMYRRRPEKMGKQISYGRFCYMGLRPDNFTEDVHVELAPPLTEEGRSEFWEALGRRFTGLPYQEADALSQQNKEFIRSLFPPEDIYIALLSSSARLVMGRVGLETRPAQYMLENMGFRYIHEVDPFDGGPHYRARIQDLVPIKQGVSAKVHNFQTQGYNRKGIIGFERDGEFRGGMVSCEIRDNEISIAPSYSQLIGIEAGTSVFFCPTEKAKGE